MTPAPSPDKSLYELPWPSGGKSSWRLAWEEPQESDFQASYAARYRDHMSMGLGVGALAMVVSAFEEFMLPAGERAWPLLLRFGLVLPAVLALLWLVRRPSLDRYQQAILTFATLGGAAAFLLMAGLVDSPLGRIYLDTLVLIQIFGLTLLRMQFTYAVVCALVIAAGTTGALFFLEFPGSGDEHVIDLMLITFAGMLCLVANYLMERYARSDYEQQRQLEQRQRELEDSNAQLEQLLRSDALTGLANRRYFDQTLADEFRRAERGNSSLALLMLDVDCFKQYNDTYGHQAGDDTLVAVARSLKQFARRPGDIAARYGGEEFALILPGSNEADALAIAGELVAHLYGRQLPHVSSRVCDRVTVSVGAAAILPTEGKAGVSDLIANADQALYLAKARGRNRACSWTMVAANAGLFPGGESASGPD